MILTFAAGIQITWMMWNLLSLFQPILILMDVELAIFVPADFNPDGINNISPDEMI